MYRVSMLDTFSRRYIKLYFTTSNYGTLYTTVNLEAILSSISHVFLPLFLTNLYSLTFGSLQADGF